MAQRCLRCLGPKKSFQYCQLQINIGIPESLKQFLVEEGLRISIRFDACKGEFQIVTFPAPLAPSEWMQFHAASNQLSQHIQVSRS